MKRKPTELDDIGTPEDPIEDQQQDWANEDVDIENRKPDLAEIEEDQSEL